MFHQSGFGVAVAVILVTGCGGPPAQEVPAGGEDQGARVVVAAGAPLVVFLGDSLTAGYGLGEEQAFPAVLQGELARRGVAIRVVNAGVSGDTTAGGLARLEWLLDQRPDVLVVGLGANDGLRGQRVETAEDSLRQIIRRSQAVGARVLLLGMQVPRSMGSEYSQEFAGMYPRLARELGVPLVPFLLEGVAGRRSLNLEDGIHPNAEGQRILAGTVRPHLEKVLRSLPGR